jgi:vacuolar-type H+-ATPase subunit F/Vma7
MTPYVLGEQEVVLGFALIGISGSAPANREEALQELTAASERRGEVLLLVTEAVAEWIRTEMPDAILKGTMVQVIPGVRPVRKQPQDSQALLLSALGIKL